MNVKILSTSTVLPEFTRPTSDALPYLDIWLADQPQRFRDKVKRIFKYSLVDQRYSIIDIDDVFSRTSFEDKNRFYAEKCVELGTRALETALEKARLKAQDIDIIISVSCTGIMIPSMDAFIINNLRMKPDITRLPVTEMGCAGGVSALIYAYQMLKDNPGKKAAIVAVESPMSTFQHDDFSMTNMVSAAIFGDGAACAILGDSDELLPSIVDTEMYHFYDEIGMMGFDVVNSGLKMILDPSVPEKIENNLMEILRPIFDRNNLELSQLDHFVFHPGGKRIVQIVENEIHPFGKNIDVTKETLRKYGNMSSATILYVLNEYLQMDIKKEEKGLMLSFGPGFSAQQVLLEWK